MPVATPSLVSITNVYEKHFNVNLTDLVTNATSYTVQIATTAGGSTIQSLIVTNPATASFDIYNAVSLLTLGTTYYVRVSASNSSSVVIGTSNEIVFNYTASVMKPDTLASVTELSTNSFRLNFLAQATPTMPTVTYSVIIYYTNGTTVQQTLSGPYSTGQSVVVNVPTPGATFYYKLTATNSNGSRTGVNTGVLMNPAPPYDIFVSVNKRTLTINWTPDGEAVSYRLYVSTGPNQANGVFYSIVSPTTNYVTTLDSDGDYYISIYSIVGTGRGSKNSAFSPDVIVSISTISKAHMSSIVLATNALLSIDNSTTFLAHYDITPNDVISGIAPTTNIATLRPYEGRFGGGIAIDEGTTNLLTGTSNMTIAPWVVSNGWTTAPASVTRTLDYGPTGNLDATKYVVVSGGDGFTYQSTAGISGATTGRKYTSTWWVKGSGTIKINHAEVGGLVGARDSGYSPSIILTSQWQPISLTAALVDNDRTSLQARLRGSGNITMYVWQPQFEQQPYKTSFVNGTRADGQLSYPISSLGMSPVEGTLSFWAKLPYSLPYTSSAYQYLYMSTASGYAGDKSLNFWAQNNGYNDRIIGSHWVGTDNVANHLPITTSQVSNYNNGGWNMYTITWKNPNGYKVYINGVLAGSAGNGKTLRPFDSTTLDIKGMLLDELRIDGVERSAEEILSWYHSNFPFMPRGIYTVAY
jgi:hypothetical protein